MTVPNRTGSAPSYRYGFQGQEKDDELKGEGNSLNYTFRMHDPRVGRFFARDPLISKYPFYSPYSFSGNRVIDSGELEGKEPEVKITQEIVGVTFVRVYGFGNVTTTVANVYKGIVQYTDTKGTITKISTFNVVRDGWFDMGTNAKGNIILYNRSSDPSPDSGSITIESKIDIRYGVGTPAFNMSDIKSPLLEKYNKTYFILGKPEKALDADIKRNGGVAKFTQFHVTANFDHLASEYGTTENFIDYGGGYGCLGIVNTKQVYEDQYHMNYKEKSTSNTAMIDFGKAIEKAHQMQIDEYGKDKKVEVKFEKRDYEKEREIPK